MPRLTYLSLPYSDPDHDVRDSRVREAHRAMAEMMASGDLIVCPAVMNHEALDLLRGTTDAPGTAYWRDLEQRLASASDDLVILTLRGWDQSRGVAREIALFEAAGKPVRLRPPQAATLHGPRMPSAKPARARRS